MNHIEMTVEYFDSHPCDWVGGIYLTLQDGQGLGVYFKKDDKQSVCDALRRLADMVENSL